MFFWYIVTIIINAFQALTLFVSLMSLVQESNFLPPEPIAAGECLSLLLLTVSTLRTIQQKDLAKQIEQEKHSLWRRSKMLRNPSRRPQLNAFRRNTRYRSKRSIPNTRRTKMRP